MWKWRRRAKTLIPAVCKSSCNNYVSSVRQRLLMKRMRPRWVANGIFLSDLDFRFSDVGGGRIEDFLLHTDAWNEEEALVLSKLTTSQPSEWKRDICSCPSSQTVIIQNYPASFVGHVYKKDSTRLVQRSQAEHKLLQHSANMLHAAAALFGWQDVPTPAVRADYILWPRWWIGGGGAVFQRHDHFLKWIRDICWN